MFTGARAELYWGDTHISSAIFTRLAFSTAERCLGSYLPFKIADTVGTDTGLSLYLKPNTHINFTKFENVLKTTTIK